ncbi:MAG: septal ring lytic transglycosylase RlpA family protein [Acetobacteraceae bacterium]|nr:septal ring lytic transglycosylase RlpA family protein [Acetobacteraceae bacterium]
MAAAVVASILVLAIGSTADAAERDTEARRAEAAQPAAGRRATTARPQRGEASYYHPRFEGRRMANGERFDPDSDSAAHRTLPFGTRARVTNLANGRTAEVTIEDRGPYVRGRIIDVTPETAGQLGMRESGTAPVEVRPVGPPRQDQAGDRR